MNREKGLTLIEILVVVGIFAGLSAVISGIFLANFEMQKRTTAIQKTIGEVSYAMEYITRAIRMARNDYYETCLEESDSKSYTYGNPEGADGIQFINHEGKCIKFFLDAGNEILKKGIKNGDNWDEYELTSGLANIEKFKTEINVFPDGGEELFTDQPSVTILIVVGEKEEVGSMNDWDSRIQTTVTKRRLDIERLHTENDGEAFSCGESLDYEGYTYATVEIGNQCWFAEDLRYDDGCTGNTWNETEPYNACDTQGTGYDGLFYQWGAAMEGSTTEGAQGLCPDGWHVPTNQEWGDLESWLSNNGYDGVEGDALKDPAENWCYSATCGGTGFLALPGGFRDMYGLHSGGSLGTWWSSSLEGSAPQRSYLYDSYSGISRFTSSQNRGYGVRCLRD